MSDFDESRLPGELQDAARQIRTAKRQATEDELDRLKPSFPREARPRASAGGALRGRLVTAALTLVLIGGGGGAVIAASGGGAEKGLGPGASAAKHQYCPPSSPGAGQPKGPPGCGNRGVKGQKKCKTCPREAPSNHRLRGKTFPDLVRYQPLGLKRNSHGRYRVFKLRFDGGRLETWRYYGSYNGGKPRWTKK